jgi:hypothetical protein
LPLGETGQFVEPDVLKLGGVVLIYVVLGVQIPEGDGRPRREGEALIGFLPHRVGPRQPLPRPVHDRVGLVELAKGAPEQQRVVARVLDQLQGAAQQPVGLAGTGGAAEEGLLARTQQEGQLFGGGQV